MRIEAFLSVLCIVALSSCSSFSGSKCSSPDAKAAVTQMMQKSTEEKVRKLLDEQSSLAAFDRARLVSALKKGEFTLSEVRTTRSDPDSTRKFCSATLRVSFPEEIWQTIQSARNDAGADSWEKLANRLGLDHDASRFSGMMEYSVQPTDDGSKLIAESDAASPFVELLGELFAGYLRSADIRMAKVEQDKANAQQAAEQAAIQSQAEAATKELAAASLSEAQAANKLAAQRIAAVWSTIPRDQRTRLAPVQTAWNRKTSAQCTVEAAGQSTDPTEVRAAKLTCETRALQDRAGELERFASYNGDTSAAESDGD